MINEQDRFAPENFQEWAKFIGCSWQEMQAKAKEHERLGQSAIGKPFTVKDKRDRKLSHVGVINKVEFGGFRQTPRGVVYLFKIEMLCGKNQVPRTYRVDGVPR